MEMVTLRSEAMAVKKLIVSTFVVETVLAAQRSMICFLLLAEVLLKNKDGLLDLIGGDQRFPVDELHRRKHPEAENVDGSDTEDDDEDDDDVEQDDEGDEDFSGEEGGEDDEEGDPEEEPVANGNDGSDDEDDEDEEDGDDDEDADEEEDEEEDDEDEEDAPPAKKRK
ncbi:Ankyrin repeat family protein with DHHC zinc finger domain [Heracleum sosnowskyi]|uniref:Ankyrin repeat family protein with DHHC zinc finger domain n=1 Tax=Heracleum sosnowskyi TaxID=360622 RepID=A0AAD8JK00_9APIA|nr:Ankyrin repeat family protein with DHHC zinc finger domain [Heracleum sosnowskyi]